MFNCTLLIGRWPRAAVLIGGWAMGMFANEKEKWIEYQKQEMREKRNMTHHHSILQREKNM